MTKTQIKVGSCLNSISRARLNFRRLPILCTTLYRNPTQASNFGSAFDQHFLRNFLWNFHRRSLYSCSIPWCKNVENDQKLKSRGSCLKTIFGKLFCESRTFRFVFRGQWDKFFQTTWGGNQQKCSFFSDKDALVEWQTSQLCTPGSGFTKG